LILKNPKFFFAKKCGRPHLKNPFPPCPQIRQTSLPPDCGHILRTALFLIALAAEIFEKCRKLSYSAKVPGNSESNVLYCCYNNRLLQLLWKQTYQSCQVLKLSSSIYNIFQILAIKTFVKSYFSEMKLARMQFHFKPWGSRDNFKPNSQANGNKLKT